MQPEEIARRALPWYIMPKFSNLILSLSRDIESYIKVNEVSTVFVPSASRFLTVPHVDFELKDDPQTKTVTATIRGGWVQGFLPNGKYAKFLASTVLEDKNEVRFRYRENYSEFDVATLLKNYMRMKAGPFFAYKVEQYGKKHGVLFNRTGGARNIVIVMKERSVYKEVELPVQVYEVMHQGKFIGTVPGIIPGMLKLINDETVDPLTENQPAKQVLEDFIKEVTRVGSKLVPLSATLQSTSRSAFTYIIGEADAQDTVFDELTKKLRSQGRKMMYITGAPAYRGVRVNFFLNPENRKVYMTISILPFSAPATVVLNYPPYSVAPLAALMHQRRYFLRFNLGKVREHLSRRGITAGFYDADYEVLGDAKVTFDEIRTILKDGYPRLSHLRPLLYKLEPLGYIGDIMSHAYGKETKVDEVLIKELKRLAEKEAKTEEKPKTEEKKAVTAPEEEEVVL